METTKQVTMVLDDSQISGIRVHEVVESLIRVSKMVWRLQSILEENRECECVITQKL